MQANIFKLKTLSFLWGLSFYVPIVSLYYLQNGVTLSAIVISQVFFAIFAFLGEVPTGVLADKFGQKKALFLGYFLGTLAFTLMLLYPTTLMLFVVYSLRGLANASISGSAETLLYESSSKKQFGKNLASILSIAVLASAIGSVITALLLAALGSTAYPVAVILSILANIACLILTVFIKDTQVHILAKQKGAKALEIALKGITIIRKDRTIWALTLVGVLTLSGEYFLYSVYQPYFTQNSVPAVWLGLVMSLGAMLNFVVIRNVYRLEKYLQLQHILLIFNIILGLIYIVLALWVHPAVLIIGFIAAKGLFNADQPIINDYIHERVGSDVRATVLSGVSFFQSLFQTIVRVVLGLLVAYAGISNTLLLQGIYLIVGILIGYRIMVACGCVHRISKHYRSSEIVSHT